jgi:NTE family protein
MTQNREGRSEGGGLKVQLVLGCGGARGLAHLGVIEALEEQGHEIVSVAGCSMGAVIGGVYAAGCHRPYKEYMMTLTKTKVYGLFDFTLDKQGLVKGEKILEELKRIVNVKHIEDLRMPFTAVAADMELRREKWFDSGDLYKALRASFAIPGIFTPVRENGQVLVDGGVLNPLPLDAVERREDAVVVAVNLNGRPLGKNRSSERKGNEEKSLFKDITKWLKIDNGGSKKSIENPVNARWLTELLLFSYHMTQDRVIELMIERHRPEIVVDIPRDAGTTFDFHRCGELVKIGREIGTEALNKYAVESSEKVKATRPS